MAKKKEAKARGVRIEKEPVFLNISNEPSSTWSEAQLAAASMYGKIIDIPTPFVPYNLDYQEITLLAVMYAERVSNEYPGTKIVQIMGGEATFDFTLVGILQFRQIHCVAAAYDFPQSEGQPARREFVQFRSYPNFLTLISFNA